MPKTRIIALGALAFGVVFSVPAFAQTACIHFQAGCSDASYAVTQPAARPAAPLYNMVPGVVSHRDTQKTGAAETMQKIGQQQRGYAPLYNNVPSPIAVQPCTRVQTYCL